MPSDPPWGVGATLAWTLTAFLLSMVLATVAFGIWSAGRSRGAITNDDGVVVAFGTFAAVPVQVAVLAFAAACALGSIYGFLQGAWPFGLVEGVWACVAVWRS